MFAGCRTLSFVLSVLMTESLLHAMELQARPAAVEEVDPELWEAIQASLQEHQRWAGSLRRQGCVLG
jgi:hypothetical protein